MPNSPAMRARLHLRRNLSGQARRAISELSNQGARIGLSPYRSAALSIAPRSKDVWLTKGVPSSSRRSRAWTCGRVSLPLTVSPVMPCILTLKALKGISGFTSNDSCSLIAPRWTRDNTNLTNAGRVGVGRFHVDGIEGQVARGSPRFGRRFGRLAHDGITPSSLIDFNPLR